MASIKDLKKRIGSVKNTQQTTRAMKMVSAAKLRRAQEAVQNQRPFARALNHLGSLLLGANPVHHPLIRRLEELDAPAAPRPVLVCVVSSDRGLCGGFNTALIKATENLLRHEAEGTYRLAFVGRRAFEYFRGRGHSQARNFPECAGRVTYLKAERLARELIAPFLAHEVSAVRFVYSEFRNALSQEVRVVPFVPLDLLAVNLDGSHFGAGPTVSTSMIYEPSREALTEQLLRQYFTVMAYQILLESQAGEHGARMSAMDNATKNAGEMIQALTLQYNKQRQANITRELLEIIAGSESQK